MAKKAKSSAAKTPYQQASDEWSKRIGSAKSQARTWRFATLLSLILLILMAIALYMVLSLQKTIVYVAEVKPGHQVVNVRAMDDTYTPNQAQEESFLAGFLNDVMTLPLDPVIVRSNWLDAYAKVEGRAVSQLNMHARNHNPFSMVGKLTRSIQIERINPISKHTYDVVWTQSNYANSGKLKNIARFNGTFTLALGQKPSSLSQLLKNPFGLRVAYFSISNEES